MEETVEVVDVLTTDIEDDEAREAAEAFLAKRPDAKLYAFNVRGKTHIGRVGTYKRVSEYGVLFEKRSTKMGPANVRFLQEFLVYPHYTDRELLTELPPGRVTRILLGLQVGNEFEVEWDGEIKNLSAPPADDSTQQVDTP